MVEGDIVRIIKTSDFPCVWPYKRLKIGDEGCVRRYNDTKNITVWFDCVASELYMYENEIELVNIKGLW